MKITVIREAEEGPVARKAWTFTLSEGFQLSFVGFKVYERAEDETPSAFWRAIDLRGHNTLEEPEAPTRDIVNEALEIMRTRVSLTFALDA